jgi:hypothetical protein
MVSLTVLSESLIPLTVAQHVERLHRPIMVHITIYWKEVDAGETLDWKALRWSHPRDTDISTSGEVNINLRREVQDRHIRARARRLA